MHIKNINIAIYVLIVFAVFTVAGRPVGALSPMPAATPAVIAPPAVGGGGQQVLPQAQQLVQQQQPQGQQGPVLSKVDEEKIKQREQQLAITKTIEKIRELFKKIENDINGMATVKRRFKLKSGKR